VLGSADHLGPSRDNHDLNLEADEGGRKVRETFFSAFRIA
jgi:hypothetical protein